MFSVTIYLIKIAFENQFLRNVKSDTLHKLEQRILIFSDDICWKDRFDMSHQYLCELREFNEFFPTFVSKF